MEETRTNSWALPFGDKPILDFNAWVSAIEVLPALAGERPRLEAVDPASFDLPVEVRGEDGVVSVRVGAPRFSGWAPFWGFGRPYNLRLIVPPNVRARIHSDAGQLRVERLSGCDLDLSTGAGQLRLEDVHGRLNLRADAGQIRGERLGGSVRAQSSAGEVRLSLDSLDPGTHRVHSSMGAVRIETVPGLRVRIEASTSLGSTRNRYPSVADAETILQLSTDLGSVRVDPAGFAGEGGAWEDWRKHWSDEAFGPLNRWSWPRKSESPPPRRSTVAVSEEELKRVLHLVEQGKINADQAGELLRAMEGR